MKKNARTINEEIVEVDRIIYDLVSSVKIVGGLDQDGDLIIGEQETLPEAVERQKKMNELFAKREELLGLLKKMKAVSTN